MYNNNIKNYPQIQQVKKKLSPIFFYLAAFILDSFIRVRYNSTANAYFERCFFLVNAKR